MKQIKNRLLVFVQGTIGDTVVSIPALKAIRRAHETGTEITLLFENHSNLPYTPKSILLPTGLVDDYVSYDFRRNRVEQLIAAARLLKQLRSRNYDRVYYLIGGRRTLWQIKRDKFFFKLCRIKDLACFELAETYAKEPKLTMENSLQ
jgi:ADP-heptose:LPS heptosyltransferase